MSFRNSAPTSLGLIAAAKAVKEEAKDLRDEGGSRNIRIAIERLNGWVEQLEASPYLEEMMNARVVPEDIKIIAFHYADCLGMIGGNYRRLDELDRALSYFDRGRDLESDERLDIASSY